eukprot:TRINITY_DN276_c1_g1_i1.p1 TRINITY_DN276_c1_g1~~TRINITY_DN276_c1_g1_i1.p1  ORF type:complete len:429 (+),score=89.20 TRINITY_DN276_c1_g1_i1:101-1387(+)
MDDMDQKQRKKRKTSSGKTSPTTNRFVNMYKDDDDLALPMDEGVVHTRIKMHNQILDIFLKTMDEDETFRGELESLFISSFCRWKWWTAGSKSHDSRKHLIRECANWIPHQIWSDIIIESVCEEYPLFVFEWMQDHGLMSALRVVFEDDEDEDVCLVWTQQKLVIESLLQYLIVHRDSCWRDIVWKDGDAVHPSPVFAAKNHQRLLETMDAAETLREMIECHGFLSSNEFYSSCIHEANTTEHHHQGQEMCPMDKIDARNASFLLQRACKHDEWFALIREHRSLHTFLSIPLCGLGTESRLHRIRSRQWMQWMQRWLTKLYLKGSIDAVLRVIQLVVDEIHSHGTTSVHDDDDHHVDMAYTTSESVFLLLDMTYFHPHTAEMRSDSTYIKLKHRGVDKLLILNYIASSLRSIDDRVIPQRWIWNSMEG